MRWLDTGWSENVSNDVGSFFSTHTRLTEVITPGLVRVLCFTIGPRYFQYCNAVQIKVRVGRIVLETL